MIIRYFKIITKFVGLYPQTNNHNRWGLTFYGVGYVFQSWQLSPEHLEMHWTYPMMFGYTCLAGFGPVIYGVSNFLVVSLGDATDIYIFFCIYRYVYVYTYIHIYVSKSNLI